MSGPPEDRDAARARLEGVRGRFAARLAERVTELLAEIEKARSGETQLAESIALAHRIAGTAGSFGYTDAGEHAGAIEDVLRRIAGGDTLWDELDASVQRLRDAIE